MTTAEPELEGVFEAHVQEGENGGFYPEETKYVEITHDQDGYYEVVALDENKDPITDREYDGHRPEHRIKGALESEPEGKYTVLV